MKKIRNIFLLCIAVTAAGAIPADVERAKLEGRNNAVELCLDASQMGELCTLYRETAPDYSKKCREAGVAAIALGEESLGSLESSGEIEFTGRTIIVHDAAAGRALAKLLKLRYHVNCRLEAGGGQTKLVPEFAGPGVPSLWNRELPAGFSEEKIRFFSGQGFRIFLHPENAGDVHWLNEQNATKTAGFIVEGKEVPGYPGREKLLAERCIRNGLLLIPLEFSTPAGMLPLKRAASRQLVQGHTILQQELDRNTAFPFWVNRWVRAVRERGNRFLLIRLWNTKSPEENLRYLAEIRTALEHEKYVLAPAAAPSYPAPGGRALRLATAMVAGMLFPLAGIWLFKRASANWMISYVLINAITLAGGLAISALLFDVYFMQRVMTVPAVKILMMLPLIAAAAVLFSREEMSSFWNKRVAVKHVAIAALAAAAFALLLVRSGNTAAGWLQPDKGFRQLLENLLPVRPRTKEFLVGQPLLLLGLYTGNPVLIWGGMIGQISIINTFFHAHTPVSLSVFRTLTGMITGGLTGGVMVLLLKAAGKARRP